MVRYRARRYGSPDWARVTIEGPDDVEEILGQFLLTGTESHHEDLHVQILTPDGWEDLE